jgi:flagellin-like protein
MVKSKLHVRGLAGLDALIIFIAIVLVVSVAATALLSTTKTLLQRDQTIHKEKEKAMQAPIVVESMRGVDKNNDKRLDEIIFLIRLRAGDDPLNLNETVIIADSNAINCSSLSYGLDAKPGCEYYVTYGKRGPDYDFGKMSLGDLIEISFNGSNVLGGQEDTGAHFTFLPSAGMATEIKVTMPPRIFPQNMGLWPLNG